MKVRYLFAVTSVLVFALAGSVRAQESIWIEAEHLDGITGYCWPMGRPEMKKTAGHWALSGPGWAAEWNQGGESGFLSIACGADDDKAVATKAIEIPVDGTYRVWVRYCDVRETPDLFTIALDQPGAKTWSAAYGEKAVVDEDNEAKLYWNWAFGWEAHEATLKKGPATLSLKSIAKSAAPRQIDIIVITSDKEYRPFIKDRPTNYASAYLATLQGKSPAGLEPLAKRHDAVKADTLWKPKTYKGKGFIYLWNMSKDLKWASEDPNRVPVPYHLRDADVLKAFEEMYAGKTDVPIFSDPRIVPTFHCVGPGILQTDSTTEEIKTGSQRLVKWLDANPDRLWATMMNYYPDTPLTPGASANFAKYRDRYVGSIAGENIGYFEVPAAAYAEATVNAKTRRDLAEAMRKVDLAANAEKYRKVLGKDLDEPFRDVISCLSNHNIQFAPLIFDWGARTVGYESTSCTYIVIPMRMAFLRGAARQHGGLTATYRSSNFGDSATMFSKSGNYSQPTNILDNYYSVYSGSGVTWYKFDIWYQYMAGSSMFFHEQGFDEFWMPGGTTAAGQHPIQLSPKGKLVDRFLRLTAKDFDRGTPVTPVAFLVDYAHGWEPTSNWPGTWSHHAIPLDKTPGDTDHLKMMQEYVFSAYYPIIPRSQRPLTATSETFVPSVLGDIYDVIYAYPDAKKWTTIDTYPVVIVTGDIPITQAEGERLVKYVENGGTLVVTQGQFSGPGAAALKLPATGAVAEATGFIWLDSQSAPSQRYRFKPITAGGEGSRVLAKTEDGKAICTAFDRGKGRLIYFSVPMGLGIDRSVHPVFPRLLAHLSRSLMPVEVAGDVEWSVNQTEKGYMVTLLNPYGQDKTQQGIQPTDYRENRTVTIRTVKPVKSAVDRLLPTDALKVEAADKGSRVTLIVQAGAVRVIELK